ncbi:MAG: NAD(P)H-dependent oxidoreductase [Defluviitaleaceae bacterium]|nr:NAD(P)H-dependent oxidoreductase [Defluviitaleaceae bacterium]
MKTILLINSSKELAKSHGKLNDYMQSVAKDFLSSYGFNITQTFVDKGYDLEQESQKILEADILIHQFPGWWMTHPWITKKWMDDVFMYSGKLYKSDGRHSTEPDLNYGTGGLCQGKKYMFSTTWNAPIRAFTDPTQFFEGKGIDGVLFHMHKAHQFLGMTGLPSFMCNDVVKSPNVEKYKEEYKEHLNKYIVQNH